MRALMIPACLFLSSALAQAPPAPDYQTVAAELQAQMVMMSTRAASCAADLAAAKREVEAAKPKDQSRP